MMLYVGLCASAGYTWLWSNIGILIQLLAAEPRSKAGRSRKALWNDLANPVYDGMGLARFKSKANALLLA